MLSDIQLRHFRCFDALDCEFALGMNVFVGPNAQGKTSLLEAVCVLLRLQSPRVSKLAHAIQHGRRGFVLDGHFAQRHMQFYFSRERKKLAVDSVEQKSSLDYLDIGRVVYFANPDIELVRGMPDHRRKFLDFVAAQLDSSYRKTLRAYEKALRSRNLLLKAPRQNWREISAFNAPLIETGNAIAKARTKLVTALQPHAEIAQRAISNSAENLELQYVPGGGENFADALEKSRNEDLRLRQTSAGPHRDDLAFFLNDTASEFASEGQQRSIALSLKLAQAKLLEQRIGTPPLLLLDDIFGELDVTRRNALLQNLPAGAQQLITTTHVDWMARDAGQLFHIAGGKLTKS